MMSTFSSRIPAALRMAQLRQTIRGCLELLWYAFGNLRVLRIVPVGGQPHRRDPADQVRRVRRPVQHLLRTAGRTEYSENAPSV